MLIEGDNLHLECILQGYCHQQIVQQAQLQHWHIMPILPKYFRNKYA